MPLKANCFLAFKIHTTFVAYHLLKIASGKFFMWNKLNKVNTLVMCESYVLGQTMKEMY